MNKLLSSLFNSKKAISFCFFCCLFFSASSFAQDTKTDSLNVIKVDSTSQIIINETIKDSTKTKEKLQVELEPKFKLRPPTRAALLSAALPGAGQYYNKKAWALKVPLVYVALGVPAYLSITNHANYRDFRENYLYMLDENPATQPDDSFVNRSADQVKRQRDSYRRDRDFYMIVTGLMYLLNIGEATTTAHFNNFDIDDDISFKFEPQMENIGINRTTVSGISLVMTF
ncbi:hypothetical protein Fleli_1962 [Bernardetia litoralis DSM 6794]|uniref:DUF5683 domain-containing protein n=1 Tax=Bernardetia litoralis (strain ATCC 23117 / DSM 6794 / NBRC 15988 / NCIMB 1366 / Fx l1 / Sio-4) TaxID=880071 RepID=I4AK62_BERLS|nr:DUF5683 domain-containing protein [Bernardetia litoralis]AFM04347.1 hypothetical protein Fleli_1962 [Bernardetia litoralis DSM 6794]